MRPLVNKDATRNYKVLETLTAGIKLLGIETKSVRGGLVSFKGSFVTTSENEIWIKNLVIRPYQPKNTPDSYEQDRVRKLLLTKEEQKRLIGKLKEKGVSLIPLRIFAGKSNLIKVEIAIAKGKTKQDKREDIKKKEANIEMARALKRR